MPYKSRAELEAPPPVQLVRPSGELPPPPGHLSEAMQTWWRQVMADYALDAHHLRLLECACDSWDTMTRAREEVRAEGLTVPGPGGSRRRHPAVTIENDSRIAFARLLRELDLDCEPPPPERGWKPPAIRSNRRR